MMPLFIPNEKCEAELRDILNEEIRSESGYETFKGGMEAFFATCDHFGQPVTEAAEALGIAPDLWKEWLDIAGMDG